jgi:tRNA A37 methylthiotransferase MiaB
MDRRVDVDYVAEMIKMTRRKGLEAGTFIMLGYPGETEEDIQITVDYLKDCQPDQFTITVAYPIKGTSLYKEVEDKQIAELDWTMTTDRDRDFVRTYSRKYYDYAVRWVVNEVNATRVKATSSKLKMRTKSVLLRQLMQLEKLRG